MGVNSLPKTVTRQRRGCDLNPSPSAPESSTLTTRLPSHPSVIGCTIYTSVRPCQLVPSDQERSPDSLLSTTVAAEQRTDDGLGTIQYVQFKFSQKNFMPDVITVLQASRRGYNTMKRRNKIAKTSG